MYKLAEGGKRFRGGLVALGYEIASGKINNEILTTSLFIEVLHLGLLIHDDFMDKDSLRRGNPTIHAIYKKIGKELKVQSDYEHFGNAIAVCAGDIALFMAYEILSSANLDRQNVIKAIEFYSKNIIRIAHGQALDVTNIRLDKISENYILKVLQLKSAEYSGSIPMLTGAILGGMKNKKTLKAIENYGLSLGWAFQITDDILGIYADENELGKPVGSDLIQAKNTILMLHLSKFGNRKQKIVQKKLMGKQIIDKSDLNEMRRTLEESGSLEYARKLANKYVKKGISEIPKITKDKRLQEILRSTIVYLVERTN